MNKNAVIRALRMHNKKLMDSNNEYKAALIILKKQLSSMADNIVIPESKFSSKVYFKGGKNRKK